MTKLFEIYDRILGAVTRLAGMIAGLCILVTAFIIVYEIIMRGVFHSPTSWVMEISTYLIIAAGFLGMAYTLRAKGHINVDFLTSRLSPATQRFLDILTSFLSILLLYVCMTESVDYVTMTYTTNKLSPTLLRIPLYIPQLFMIAGFTLLFFEMIRRFWADLIGYDEKKEA